MDKLNFKDMLAHYDPDRDDPDGYFQHRMRRRRSGVLGEEMTPEQLKKREKIVKALKANTDFRSRYGRKSKDVMYAIATKHAMNEDLNEGKKLGLWDRIRKKRERGEPPAKPGEEGYPSKEAWKRLTKEDVQLDEISAYLADRARKKAKEDLEKEWERKPKTPEEAEKSMEKMHRRLRQHGKFLNYKPRNEEVELDEVYVIKHKKTKQVLNTHSDYATAKDEHEGLGADKHEYGVYKQTKKDAALRNRNTYREEVELDEALNMAQRLKRARIMKRVHKKIEMGQKRAKRRMANMETLKRRAIKTARKFILKRLTKGIPKEELSPARKQELEKKLNTPAMKKRIQMVAMKMLKDVRKREVERHRAKQ